MSEAVDDPTEHDPSEDDPSERSDDASPAAADPPTGGPATVDADGHGHEELGEIDVVGIEADLDGVQAALTRLADGTYWTDEVTGEPIPSGVLAADPLARRA